MKQILIAIDQLLNTLLGGWADETLSCRARRLSSQSEFWETMRRVIDSVFFWQKNHCEQCYEWEQNRMDLPPELR